MKEPYVTPENLRAKAMEWKGLLSPFRRHAMVPRWEHTALLVIDMQRYFLDPGGQGFTPGGPPILANVKRMIAAFRGRGFPIVYSTHVHRDLALDGGMMAVWWGDHVMEGTPAAQIHPEIAPASNDKVIVKHRYSAFYNTDLDITLRCLGITDLVITGVMTNLCCESTARDAFLRDFRVFFLLDGTGAVNERFHVSTLLNLAYGFAYVTDTEELLGEMARGDRS
jgi:nicotinamidase-related amidase